ncbi:hypothetical protein SEA_DELIAN_49 [Gordonia phage Delian]|uniref:hypothetical protein n=1 Tax=Gordonia phage CaptainKirk2 TaxID=1887643 RepID=UPI00084EFCBC|nr:hypothetical protein BIZ76_gp46 [Gordonia phage CaptainKirk2]AXH67471.1 hypothetical protein SEA_ZARBODNAMRA_45 [Gordonia phage Zarbodnamra]QDB74549.1 hypothetical protein SEA_MELBA_45 [Gordonia phage Melba]QDH85367.1 hypothetical protein SEA_MINTFEN_46 [Gordonia phage MintFen]QGH77969.1 hypothetical protein SEA_DELIAN_49 [Gordonia phage Delian]QKO02364.1 hypothetical protein SEA_BLINGBLING_43 [Gordonia phage BlingBling]QNJ58454.1 hypothetical protein SEA_ARCHIS_49 [Gordonia phage Archis]
MSNTMNYRGDCTEFDPEQILGPDVHGAYYRIVDADYDRATDMTKRTFKPIPPSELFGGQR